MPWVGNTQYHHILGFSRYAINKNGDCFNILTNETIEAQELNTGYFYFNVKDDLGKTRSLGRHRALALAFLPIPEKAEIFEVNHIDGVPGNDTLDNLEWVTRSGNINHAYENGLRSDNKKIILRNRLGDEKEFRSLSHAARFLNCTQTTVTNRCKNPEKMYDGWYYFCNKISLEKNILDWVKNPIEVLDIQTGNIEEYANSKEMYKVYRDIGRLIRKRLIADSMQPLHGKIFKSKASKKNFPNLTEDFKKYWKLYKPGSQPVKVFWSDGRIEYYSSIQALSSKLGLERSSLSKKLNRGDSLDFEIIKLTPF